MKNILSLIFAAISFCAISQTTSVADTIFLRDGTFQTGSIIREEMMYYMLQPTSGGSILNIEKSIITRTSKGFVNSALVTPQYKAKVDSISLRDEIKSINLRLDNSGWKLKSGGTLGIAGISIGIVGAALAIAGAATNSKPLQWVGVGFSGVGVTLSIASFAKMHYAGVALRKKE